MPSTPKALLLKFPGTNCDAETKGALQLAGFDATVQPISIVDPATLSDYQLLVFSGGFSYGDYIMAGRLAKLELERRLGTAVQDYYANGGHLLGICNGFQILSEIGVLPASSLIQNTTGRFVCRWASLKKQQADNPYLNGLPEEFELPVAHAEGRLVSHQADKELLGHATLTYGENFNGSTQAIAGMQDESGRVFGLMPHPERFIQRRHHYDPDWAEQEYGWGYYIFQSIYQHLS